LEKGIFKGSGDHSKYNSVCHRPEIGRQTKNQKQRRDNSHLPILFYPHLEPFHLDVCDFISTFDRYHSPPKSPNNKIFSCSFSLVSVLSVLATKHFVFTSLHNFCIRFENSFRVRVGFGSFFHCFFFGWICLSLVYFGKFSLFMFDGITYRRLRLGQTNLSGIGEEMSA